MLFGRGREQGRINRLLRAARAGHGGALLLHGEAGVGKSALLAHAVARASGALLLSAQGLESESELGFAGLASLLGPLLPRLDSLPRIQRDALAGALGLGPPWSGERFTTFQAASTLLAEASREGPVVAVVDDVQWLDGASQQALRFVARRLEDTSVALVMTRRDEGIGEEPWSGVDEVLVPGLDEDASLALLERSGIAPGVGRRITAVAAGNALALTQAAVLLSEAQRSGSAPLDDPLPIGERLTTAFSARAAGLGAEARAALVVAAASESGHAGPIARALADLEMGIASLLPAEETGLVTIDGSRVVFGHPLIRAAVLASAPPAERREAHAALAAHTSGDARAWHLSAAAAAPDEAVAGELEAVALDARARGALPASSAAFARAASLTPDAGARAVRRLQAGLDALEDGQLEHAIALLDAVVAETDDPLARADAELLRGAADMLRGHPLRAYERLYAEARRVEPLDGSRAARMLCQAGVAFMAVGGMPQLRETSQEARRAALAAGDEEAAILPTIQLALAMIADGGWDEARPLLDAHEEFLGAADPLGPMNEVLGMVCICLAWVEDFDRAEALAAHQVEAARSAGATRALAFPLAVHASVVARRGELALAALEADEAVALAEETASGMVLSFALGLAARIDAMRGNDARCRERAERSLEIATSLGLDAVVPYGRSALGLLELSSGSPDAALELLRSADRAARTAGVVEHGVLYLTSDGAEAAVRARRPDDVRERLAQLERDAALVDRVFTRTAIERYRGVLAPGDEFEAHFEAALALHDRLTLPVERGRTLLLYGERLRRTRRRGDARMRLEEALVAFETAGAAPWAARARSELEAARGTGRRAAAAAVDEPLTPQETRIAELVATGATNKEIAERLFLSPRTVEFHLRGAFRKLGVRSRTELAAALRERGDGRAA